MGVVEKYKVDVAELTAKLDAAVKYNDELDAIASRLTEAGFSEAAIEAALEAEYGSSKNSEEPKERRKLGPNRTKEPTELELKVLRVLTNEPMSRKNILDALNGEGREDPHLLVGMAKLGLVENVGGKGRGASWVLTEKGSSYL